MQLKAILFSLFLFPAAHATSKDDIGDTFIDEISGFITFIFEMIKDYVIEPPLRILRNFFGGLSESIYSVGVGMFSGATGAMNAGWATLTGYLSFFGPIAPIIAAAVIWSVVVIAIWFVFDIILDMLPFGLPFEKERED